MLTLGLWSGLLFGLLEGVAFVIIRPYPMLLAAHKVSPDILWVSPLVDIILFALLALAFAAVLPLVRRMFGLERIRAAGAAFVGVGVFSVLTVPRMMRTEAAAVLALGIAVLVWRVLGSRTERLVDLLIRYVWCIPLLLAFTALGTSAYEHSREWWLARGLPPAPKDAPNVLIIVMDTVRKDRFPLGSEKSLTPRLDQYIARGVRYENAWSTTSWSLPAQFSILYGAHLRTGDRIESSKNGGVLGIPEFLAQRGYVTGAFSSNASWVTPEYLGAGFIRFRTYRLEDLLRRTRIGRVVRRPFVSRGFSASGRGKEAPQLTAEFLSFLDAYPGRPFFGYLCYMDVNRLMHYSKNDLREPVHKVVEAYDRGLQWLDTELDKLFSELQRRGVLENTILVLVSDHGESFGSRAGDHDPAGHAGSLYPDQVAIPLFIIYPAKVPARAVVTDPVSVAQIPATAVQMLGMPPPNSWEPPLPGAAGGSARQEAPIFMRLQPSANLRTTTAAIIEGPWMFLRQYEEWEALKKGEQLFNLADDPQARTNLSGREDLQARRGAMREWLDAWVAKEGTGPSR
jgi:arylsulfatase A-like enzyme